MKRFIAPITISLLLAGCSSGPAVNHNSFTMLDQVPAAAYTAPYRITVRLPRLYETNGIVIKTSPLTLYAAKNHHWAMDLNGQLSTLLTDALMKSNVSHDAVLTLTVSEFFGDLDGNITIRAHLRSELNGRTAEKSYQYSGRQEADGYDAMVDALKKGWLTVAQQMAADIQ